MTLDIRLQIQAELLTLIAGSDNGGVAEVCASQSVRELIQRDADGSLPAVGVAYRGFQRVEDESVAVTWYYADTRWEVSIVDRAGTRPSALESVMEIVGRISDRIHGARSAIPPLWSWEVVHEEVEDVEDDAVAGVLYVELRAKVGS